METTGVILIALLLIALYVFIGWCVYLAVDECDYKLDFDAEEYGIAIISLWPLTLILLCVVGAIQFVKLVKDIANKIKKR